MNFEVFETKKVSIEKTLRCQPEGATHEYSVVCTIVGNELTKVAAAIIEQVEKQVPGADGNPTTAIVPTQIGNMIFDGGKIKSIDFPYTDKYVEYNTGFNEIISRIISPTPVVSEE